MITIEAIYRWIDWATYEPHNIDESKIWGFELYWRGGGDWFVKVVPKNGDKYYLGSGVGRRGISELLANPKATILGIFNDRGFDGFLPELIRVLPETKQNNTSC